MREDQILSHDFVKHSLRDLLANDDVRILTLPPKMFEPHRILIMKLLYRHGTAEFRQLKHELRLSDGNLSSHLQALEAEQCVDVVKEIVDKKIRTTYELTKKGKQEFVKFATFMSLAARLEETE